MPDNLKPVYATAAMSGTNATIPNAGNQDPPPVSLERMFGRSDRHFTKWWRECHSAVGQPADFAASVKDAFKGELSAPRPSP